MPALTLTAGLEVEAPPNVDAALVARLRAGDAQAAGLLYARHAARVGNLAARLVGNRADAEDVLHDAFVTALVRLPQLREPAAFGAWLRQIAVHGAHRRLRWRRLRARLGLTVERDATLAALAHPSMPADRVAELSRIDAVLGEMPTVERAAWMLRHVEGMTLPEVAEGLGISLATVKRRLQRAADRVARHVSGEGTR